MSKKRSGPAIFTLGYEGLTIEQFVAKLLDNSIRVLVDVRKNAISRKAGFSKKKLSAALESAGIGYRHFPELGIPSSQRKNLDTRDPNTYHVLFDYYETSIVPRATGAVDQIKELARRENRIAVACFEADHSYCHRSRLGEVIQRDVLFADQVYHI